MVGITRPDLPPEADLAPGGAYLLRAMNHIALSPELGRSRGANLKLRLVNGRGPGRLSLIRGLGF